MDEELFLVKLNLWYPGISANPLDNAYNFAYVQIILERFGICRENYAKSNAVRFPQKHFIHNLT